MNDVAKPNFGWELEMIVLAHGGHEGAWIETLVYVALILGPIAFLLIFARFVKEKPPSNKPD